MNTKTKTNKVLNNIINKILLITIFSTLILSSVASASQIIVSTNRLVVLDDPNTGTVGAGFFNPSGVRGGSWNSNLWSGESTTIRAAAVVTNDGGSPLSGTTVTFKLRNPGGTIDNAATTSSVTNSEGIAYYSFNMNAKNYWGYWKVESNATVGGTNIQNSTSFASNWWGCAQCHNNKVGSSSLTGKFGSYTPKSYYTMGANFHDNPLKTEHTNAMVAGACIVCHQSYNGTAKNWGFSSDSPNIPTHKEYSPDWHNGKVACQDCHKNSNSSSALKAEIAGCYDTNGCHTKKNANLEEINSTTGYLVGGNYRTNYSYIPNNISKGHTTTGITCIACHDAGHNISKPYNVSSTSNTVTENDQCWTCHTNRATTHYSSSNCVSCHTQNAHKVSLGGGPDCISCHNNAGSATHKVDTNAMVLGEHANLNSGATASGVPVENKKCWGCHQTGGTQPTGMGDRYQNPYKCYDCHNATKPYANVNSAPIVSEHFKSGTDIQAAMSATDNSTSCLTCHNITEMKVSYTESDGLNNGSSLASHYGKNRSDLRVAGGSITDCIYCHQNTSTAFSGAMTNTANDNMANHSTSLLTPACTECHDVGKIHDSSLNKPVSDDNLCKTCHFGKSEHNSTLSCTECHANNSDGSLAGKDIHGIKFLQKDNTFSQDRVNSADCTTCHQLSVVDGSIGIAPPKISDPLHHSDDATNGSKWGTYWTGANPITACVYCHNDTRHSATPLGRPLIWNTSYIMGTTIGTGTNCADCHQKGDSDYNAMKLTFEAKALPIPPEITNGSWNGEPGYFNHTLADYTDARCKSCHYQGSSTVGQMLHDVSVGGGGGTGCIECHNSVSPSSSMTVDIDVFNNSIHQNINNSVPDGAVTNDDCWACHYNQDMNRQNIRKCKDCHAKPSQWHGNANVDTNLTNLSIR